MIAIETPLANVLAVELSGTVEESDIQTMEDAFERKLDTDDRFGLVVDMSGWTDITAGALKEDAKFEFGLLGKLNRFPRMALISDKKFPLAVAKFLDPLIPLSRSVPSTQPSGTGRSRLPPRRPVHRPSLSMA